MKQRVLYTLLLIVCSSFSYAADKHFEIVFDSDRDGDRDIYVLNTETNKVMQLTKNKSADGIPDWSPDGQKIIFFSDRDGDDEIFIMDWDGSNQRQLTNNQTRDRAASWSPDGQSIAFVSDRDGNEEIYIMNQDGSNQRRLTKNTHRDFWPDWSPDGRYISYTSFFTTQDTYLVDVSELSNLVIPQPRLIAKNTSRAEWSPNGKQIAFSGKQNARWNIFVMNVDGTERKRVYRKPGRSNWVPTWSPDGEFMVFSSEHGWNADIVELCLNDQSIRVLTKTQAQNWRPVIRPDIGGLKP